MRLTPRDESTYSAPEMAILIDAGYLTGWPHQWTRDGSRAIRRAMVAKRTYDGDSVIREALQSFFRTGLIFQSGGLGRYGYCANDPEGELRQA